MIKSERLSKRKRSETGIDETDPLGDVYTRLKNGRWRWWRRRWWKWRWWKWRWSGDGKNARNNGRRSRKGIGKLIARIGSAWPFSWRADNKKLVGKFIWKFCETVGRIHSNHAPISYLESCPLHRGLDLHDFETYVMGPSLVHLQVFFTKLTPLHCPASCAICTLSCSCTPLRL